MVNGWISPRMKFRKFIRFGNCIEEIHESKYQLDIILKTEGERERFMPVLLCVFMQAKNQTGMSEVFFCRQNSNARHGFILVFLCHCITLGKFT